MTIKLIPELWRNQEIPEKFWKIYEQVKLDLFQNFYLFLIVFLIPEFCHPEPGPTTLRSYLKNYVIWNTFFFYFLGFPKTNHEKKKQTK